MTDRTHSPLRTECESGEPTVEPASLVRNSTFLLAARFYNVVASGLLSVVTVRVFSVTEYGEFAIALALVQVTTSLSELGIATLGTRRLVQGTHDPRRVLGVMVAAEILGSLAFAALLLPAALLLGYSGEIIVLLALGVGLIVALGVHAAFAGAKHGQTRAHQQGGLNGTRDRSVNRHSARLYRSGGRAAALIVVMTMAEVAAVAVAAVMLRRRLRLWPVFGGALRKVPGFLRAAAPIAASGGIAVLYGRLDLIMLSKLDSVRAVAIYNVPLTIVELTYVVPAAITTAFFPLLTKQLAENRQDADASLSVLFRLFVAGGGVVALILVLAGGDLIELVFGSSYADSGPVVAILAGVIVLNALNYLIWYALLASNQEARRWRVQLLGLALNAGLNVILIPTHGPEGAAVALLISDFLVLGWFVVSARTTVLRTSLSTLLIRPVALAGLLAVATLLLLEALSGPLVAVVAISAWIAGLFGSRYLTLADLDPVIVPLRARRLTRG